MTLQPTPEILWNPDPEFFENSRLKQYFLWLKRKYQLIFRNYDELWEWSVRDTKMFWKSIWEYFEIISGEPYEIIHSKDPMPDTKWFTGSSLNYSEHIFRNKTDDHPAILFQSERTALNEISWSELEKQVSNLVRWLKNKGVEKGDRVVAYLPNIPEATMAFLAANSIGAIWSSCSPDFGSQSVIDRLHQIEPKVMFVVDGYQYNGKPFDKKKAVNQVLDKLPTVETVVIVPYLDPDCGNFIKENSFFWADTQKEHADELSFEKVSFDHPIWILYSSGTTGMPKAITHSHGGVLLEHLKYLTLQSDVHPGERFFWFSTTGWMMWNIVQASFLAGATTVLYDGSPAYPDLNVLWRLTEEAGIHHFGTSAPFLVACMKEELKPVNIYKLDSIRSIGSTGSPLPPDAFDWVYQSVGKNIWLCSMSGGTDVCTAFVGGAPGEPVYRGEIQRRSLGCALYAFDDLGNPVVDEVGEMVIINPMPCMPICFWNDPGKKRYLSSYFEMYPGGIWRHGDWVMVTKRNTLVILGRSDATLNRHGVRIGTAEIYRTINRIEEIEDSLIVNLEYDNGNHYMPLFVKLPAEKQLKDSLKSHIKKALRSDHSPRHVPDEIVQVPDIPYTISGKKMETPVKKILMGIPVEKAANKGAMKNPDSLGFFIDFYKSRK